MISKRLQYIVDIMPCVDVVADIGADHGYVPVELIKSSKASKVIASDISKMSLKKSEDYLRKNKMENKIFARHGRGMEVLEADEVDAVIIAGMGGVLISQILKESYDKKFIIKKPILIFQPVQQAKELRYYLYENNFEIIDEYILEDKTKIYHIISAKKSTGIDYHYAMTSKNKDIYMEYGLINIKKKSDLLLKLMKKDIEKIKLLIGELKQKNIDIKKELLQDKLNSMEAVYNEIGGSL